MTDHAKMQNRLRAAVQEAILKAGRIEGTDDIALTNIDVVEALLEVAGIYGSMQTFGTYTPRDIAFKHAMTAATPHRQVSQDAAGWQVALQLCAMVPDQLKVADVAKPAPIKEKLAGQNPGGRYVRMSAKGGRSDKKNASPHPPRGGASGG